MRQRSRYAVSTAPQFEQKGARRARQPHRQRRGQGSGPHGRPIGQPTTFASERPAAAHIPAAGDVLEEIRRDSVDILASYRASRDRDFQAELDADD